MAIEFPAALHSLAMNALIKDVTKISHAGKILFMVFNRVLTDINFNC